MEKTGFWRKFWKHFQLPSQEEILQASKQESEDREKQRALRLQEQVPAQTKNFRYLGNCWCYFELEVGGKLRKFMLNNTDGYAGNKVIELLEG